MDIGKLRVDREKETDGVWTEIRVGDETAEMKVARYNNRAYRAANQRLLRPHLEAMRESEDGLPVEAQEAIEVRAFAEAILKDWRGLTNDGEPFPYSEENAVLLLTECPDIMLQVRHKAFDAEAYRLRVQKDSEGN